MERERFGSFHNGKWQSSAKEGELLCVERVSPSSSSSWMKFQSELYMLAVVKVPPTRKHITIETVIRSISSLSFPGRVAIPLCIGTPTIIIIPLQPSKRIINPFVLLSTALELLTIDDCPKPNDNDVLIHTISLPVPSPTGLTASNLGMMMKWKRR